MTSVFRPREDLIASERITGQQKKKVNTIAIFHLSVKTVSRRTGRSSIAAAAYRAGEKIVNTYDGTIHDFSKKTGVVHSEIILPDNAPQEYTNRSMLWNAVEQSENRKDARTAREIEIALPNELTLQEQIALTREYVIDNFVDAGMCADVSIHAGHKHKRSEEAESEYDKDIKASNPHAHIMLTTRPVDEHGFTQNKTSARRWNKRENVLQWRENWAKTCNREFEEKGLDERIDHRSLKDQGKAQQPSIHLGAAAHSMEQRGIQTERGDFNREVVAENEIGKSLVELNQEIGRLNLQLSVAQQQQRETIRAKNKELTTKIRHLKADSADIAEYQEAIDDNEKKFEELVAQLDKTGFSDDKEKRNIERKMFSIRYSKEQAEQGLMRKYGIAKEEIPAKLKELAEETEATTREQGDFTVLMRNIETPEEPAMRELNGKDVPDYTEERKLQTQIRTR